jgi:hypothetical protein
MPQVQLDEQLFNAVKARAAESGYSSVDEYIADLATLDLAEPDSSGTPNLDHLFTKDRLKIIDAAAADIQKGQSYDSEQAKEELARRREQWLLKNKT